MCQGREDQELVSKWKSKFCLYLYFILCSVSFCQYVISMIEVNDIGDSQLGHAFLANPHQSIEQNASHDSDDEVTRGQAWCLYCSHFLSMWNSRIYEFGAVSRTTHG